MELLVYPLVGIFAGILAGLLGVGGGLVIVPVLVWVFSLQEIGSTHLMQLAIGTSLATIVATSLSSIRAHHAKGAVLWPLFRKLAPGLLLGAWLGAMVADKIPSDTLKIFFGVFVILIGLQMSLGLKPKPHRDLPGGGGLFGAGAVIGTLSALVGIGGGSLSVPYLTWCNVEVRKAVATSAAGGLPIALSGMLGFIVMGWGVSGLPAWSSGYVYWPAFAGIVVASAFTAPLGAKLAHSLPTTTLKRIFAVFLVFVGLRMVFF